MFKIIFLFFFVLAINSVMFAQEKNESSNKLESLRLSLHLSAMPTYIIDDQVTGKGVVIGGSDFGFDLSFNKYISGGMKVKFFGDVMSYTINIGFYPVSVLMINAGVGSDNTGNLTFGGELGFSFFRFNVIQKSQTAHLNLSMVGAWYGSLGEPDPTSEHFSRISFYNGGSVGFGVRATIGF